MFTSVLHRPNNRHSKVVPAKNGILLGAITLTPVPICLCSSLRPMAAVTPTADITIIMQGQRVQLRNNQFQLKRMQKSLYVQSLGPGFECEREVLDHCGDRVLTAHIDSPIGH